MFSTLRHILEMIRFSHTLFALPFALLAGVMAWIGPGADGQQVPFRWVDLLGILLCMVFARSAAMAFNRIADRDLDADNPRTRQRHIPVGLLAVRSVVVFTIGCSVCFVACTALFLPNRLPIYFSIPVLLFLLAYSYMKRFTLAAHFWLGAALMLAPVSAWIAIRGELVAAAPADLLPAIVLGFSVLLWVSGFDIIYACQDVDYDRGARLHSVPVKLGVVGALRLAALCHLGMVVFLGMLPLLVDRLGWVYWCGMAAVVILLAYEHWLVRPDDLARVNTAFFNVNAVLSIGLFVVCAVDLLGCSRSEPVAVGPPAERLAGEPDRVAQGGSESADQPAPADEVAVVHPDVTESRLPVEPSPDSGLDREVVAGEPVSVSQQLRQVVAHMTDQDTDVRAEAVEHVRQSVENPAELYVSLLKDELVQVRRGAVFGLLGDFDPDNPAVVRAMIEALGDGDRRVRHIALQAVGKLAGPDILPAMPQLVERLADEGEDTSIRIQVVRLLGRSGLHAQDGLPTILSVLQHDQDRNLHAACMYAATKIAEDPVAVVDVLSSIVHSDSDSSLRRMAVVRLGALGSPAAPAIDNLVSALSDEDPVVRGAAADALGQIGPAAIEPLVKRFDSMDRELRILALYAVGKMGPAAESVTAQLEQLMDDPDHAVRRAAELSLLRIRGQL